MQTATAQTRTSDPVFTLAMVRSFHADPATQALKDKLFVARAKALIVRADVDELLEPAFAETDFRHEDTDERLTCEGDLYLVADDVDVSGWYRKRDGLLLAAGYDVVDGKCPALVAEHVVRDVEQELLRHASKHFGFDFTCGRLDLERRAIDLFSANVAG